MLMLPEVCDAGEAIRLIREDDAKEAARLLEEYRPLREDDPIDWPEWVDEDRWELGPEPHEISPEDLEWLADQQLVDQAVDRCETMAMLAMLEAARPGPITDMDVLAAGLPVG